MEDRRVLAVFHITPDIGDGAVGSLREAILIANRNQENDEIHLAEGIFELTVAGSNEDAAATGDLDVTEAGKSITITGAGADRSIIDGALLSDRLLEIVSGVTVTLQGITLRNGSHVIQGGAIRNAGKLELREAAVSASSSEVGGGIYNASGELVLVDSVVQGNQASDGGGIFNLDGEVMIRGGEIKDNSATGSRGEVSAKPLIRSGHGGGFLNVSGTVSISDSVLQGNRAAAHGGGIAAAGGFTAVSESSVSENAAVSGGGVATLFAIDGEAAATSHFRFPSEGATLEIGASTFSRNVASREGGGLSATGGSKIDIAWSTFSGNRAESSSEFFAQGGGLYLQGARSEINIHHSTVTENTAQFAAAGIYHGSHPTVRIGNTIVAGNRVLDTGEIVDVAGSDPTDGHFVSLGNNLIGNVGKRVSGFADGSHNDLIGGNGKNPINALLGPLHAKGNLPATHSPMRCSPAISVEAGAVSSEELRSLMAGDCQGIAVPDWYTLAAGDFVLPVTANDEGNSVTPLIIESVGTPSGGGQLAISDDRTSIRYSPAAGFFGIETFTYATAGAEGKLDQAVVTVNVIAGPRAMPDEQVVEIDSGITAFDVLANDTLSDLLIGVRPLVSATSSQPGALVQISADGRFIQYTPPAGFTGEDRITYSVIGGRESIVRVRVYDPEQAVDAGDFHYTVLATPEGAGAICDTEHPACPLISVPDAWNLPVLDNNSFGAVASDLLRIVSVGEPDQGGYAQIARTLKDPWILYRPRPGFLGTETLTYVTRDLEGRESTGTVSVDVVRREHLARIRLEATDTDGNRLDAVQPGERFQLRIRAQDLRPLGDAQLNEMAVLRSAFWGYPGTLRAVQRAALRIGFDSATVTLDGDVQFGLPYADSALNSRDPIVRRAANGIELVANADWVNQIGLEDALFATIPLIATGSGPLDFTIESNSVNLATFGSLPDYALDLQGVSLDVASRFSNTLLREDVNSDGLTTPRDALILINDLNEQGAHRLLVAEGEPSSVQSSSNSYYPDVDSDGWLTPRDVLVVFNRLNQISEPSSGEGESLEGEARQEASSETYLLPIIDRNASFLDDERLQVRVRDSERAAASSPLRSVFLDWPPGDSAAEDFDFSRPTCDERYADELDESMNSADEQDLFTALARDCLTADGRR